MQNTTSIELPETLNFWSLSWIVRRASKVLGAATAGTPATAAIHMEELRFVTPSALAVFAASCLRLHRAGVRLHVHPPHDDDCHDYLNRVDFFDLLDIPVPYPWTRRDPSGRFLGLVRAEDGQECDRLAKELVDILATQSGSDAFHGRARRAIATTLAEVIENVVHHAGEGIAPIVAAQSYPQNHLVELAIVDLGMGVEASLARNPHLRHRFSSPVEAIRLALRRQVTGMPERNTGQGLFFASELAKANEGAIQVYSGAGLVEAGHRQRAMEVTPWPGAIVALRLRTDGDLDLNRIYDRYAPASLDYELIPEGDLGPDPP